MEQNSPEIQLYKNSQIISDKQRQYNGTKTAFSINDAETTECPHAKTVTLDMDLIPFHKKINSKFIRDLHIKCKSHKTSRG